MFGLCGRRHNRERLRAPLAPHPREAQRVCGVGTCRRVKRTSHLQIYHLTGDFCHVHTRAAAVRLPVPALEVSIERKVLVPAQCERCVGQVGLPVAFDWHTNPSFWCNIMHKLFYPDLMMLIRYR